MMPNSKLYLIHIIMHKEVQIFTLRLQEIGQLVPIPDEVSASLWESVAHIVTHTLVQG